MTAKPGDDLQQALDSIPLTGGELCLAAGLYELAAPLSISKRERIVIVGAGAATVLRAVGREAAVVVDGSTDVELRHLRVEGGSPAGAGDEHLNGAITVVASQAVSISDCVLNCPTSPAGKSQTCLTIRSNPAGGVPPDRIRAERNRFEVGAWETGVLLVDVESAAVCANHISRAPGTPAPGRASEPAARAFVDLVDSTLAPAGSPGTKEVNVPGAPDSLHVVVAAEGRVLVEELAARVTPSQGARGAALAVRAAGRGLARKTDTSSFSAPLKAIVAKLYEELDVAGQGIVVAGRSVGTIRISDNLVEDTVQGIHLGISEGDLAGRESAGEAILESNVIHALVPRGYDRDRHAVFVGNVRSLRLTGTVATLRRRSRFKLPATPVEAIRIHGELGRFAVVRESSLEGFEVGVRVVPLGVAPTPRLWLVAETVATGATAALDAPLSVERERNVP